MHRGLLRFAMMLRNCIQVLHAGVQTASFVLLPTALNKDLWGYLMDRVAAPPPHTRGDLQEGPPAVPTQWPSVPAGGDLSVHSA
jgi:hypothetical protein